MAAVVQAGTIFIQNRPLILRTLDLETEPYSGTWDVLHSSRSPSLDQRIRGTGWNCFFMAAEVKATVLGGLAARSVHRALKKIFAKVRNADFNCLEITKITNHRFLGVPYITICAHSRHIQQGSMMDFAQEAAGLKPLLVNSD
jgi:hypothetical protein